MNEFLQQFVIESRELVEQCTADLQRLEQAPDDPQYIDSVFRAFHTLKGGAGIVEFRAMERATHAVESTLAEVRAGRIPLAENCVAACLECLDKVVGWLDDIERHDSLPDNADAQADHIVQAFKDCHGPRSSQAEMPDPALQQWVAARFGHEPALRSSAVTALRFVPDADCFYKGEDPVARLLLLPELLAVDVRPTVGDARLDERDPFSCQLVLMALSRVSSSAVDVHMRELSGTIEVRSLAKEATPASGIPVGARDILNAQVALLNESGLNNLRGCIASAGKTAANVLRSVGRSGEAETLRQAADSSWEEISASKLLAALTQVLALAPPGPTAEVPSTGMVKSRTLRIDADRIDALVRLAGELTVAKNSFAHLLKTAEQENSPLSKPLKERQGVLEKLVAELQRSVVDLRVVPLRTVFQRIPALVRELSAGLGKVVQLQLEGEDTEADKAIVEMLFEPLLHVLRNAIDHGVEAREVRESHGKPAAASIRIRASRDAGFVHIEISDDGAGIDLDRVRRKALERQMVSAEALGAMTEAEILELIFAAGFSTAPEVTAVSGRGVGMDVVRTTVEKFGGRVSVTSQAGAGTTFTLILPFSVVMTQIVAVDCRGQLFGIPLEAVIETLRLPAEAIKEVGTARAFVLRKQTVPIFDLASLLGSLDDAPRADAMIVVASVGGQLLGLRVDRIAERMEVMLKPLEGLLAGMPGLSGTTVLGDGRVLLVLDLSELLS